MPEISSLAVHCLDGEFYADIKAYLEKQGVKWSETRGGEKELLSVFLDFPRNTTYRKLCSSDERYTRYQVIFQKGGSMYWSIRADDQLNRISVPYVYL